MTKAKLNEVNNELTDEEKAILAQYENSESDDLPSLQYLTINTSMYDKEENEIPAQTFNLSGTKLYKKTVKIRPIKYVSRLLDMRQDATKAWKTVNETIYFSRNEEPIDAAGGIGCGRLLGKATLNMTEEQKKANKSKAQFYGYLFGIVTIEGHEPVLASFRLPAGKAMTLGKTLQQIKKLGRKMHQVELTLKCVPNKLDKKNVNPDLEITFNPDEVLGNTSQLIQAIKTTDEFVNKSNERIRQSHLSSAKQRQDNTTASRVMNRIATKAAEIDSSEQPDDDDEIPF